MVKDATYVRCEAKDSESGDFAENAFKYFGGDANGGDGYFPAEFFPYKGKMNQPKYESPIVAVQVDGLEVSLFILNAIQEKAKKHESES